MEFLKGAAKVALGVMVGMILYKIADAIVDFSDLVGGDNFSPEGSLD